MGQIIDRLLCSALDLNIMFWAFLFFASCAVFISYLKGAEDLYQYTIRIAWYTAVMTIGFTIILEAIKFTKEVLGSGCVI